MKPPDSINVLNQHGGFTAEIPFGTKFVETQKAAREYIDSYMGES